MTTDPTNLATAALNELQEAWNTADGARYGGAFADDSDFVTIRGEHFQSAAVISAGHQGIFDTIYRGSIVKLELESAREVGAGIVVAVAASTLDSPAGPLQGRHRSRMTLVITEHDGRPVVAALHNTLLAEGV
jgi:uncharacterized protein (TIGR02246 family)